MSDSILSIVFNRRDADRELAPMPVENLVMALLACEAPDADWEGCEVFLGDSPLDPATTRCVGIRGPGADRVQEQLVVGLERMGVEVAGVYDGGPEPRASIARVRGGQWVEGR